MRTMLQFSVRRVVRPALAACMLCLFAERTPAAEPAPLDRAFFQLQTYDWGQSADALLALDEAIAASHRNPAARRALESRLVAILQTNAPLAARQLVCRKLALVGSEASVAALAALLAREETSHMARFALERIPEPAAAAALREALPKTRGNVRVGVINSLAALADVSVAPALTDLLREEDPATAGAAASALGKIGTLDAVRALETYRPTAPQPLQSVVNDALVTGAENLARRGESHQAARIFRQLYERESGMLRLAGFRGLVQAEPEGAARLLAKALAGRDEPLRGLAVELITDLPDQEALKPFLDSWESLPSDAQVALLEAIRLRRDAGSRSMVRAACDRSEPAVRLAALRTLGVVGTPADAALLARRATSDQREERETARTALAVLPGREGTQVLTGLLHGAASPLRVELMQALAARGATDSAPLLIPYLEDADAATRQAALQAIAVLGDEQQAPAVIAFLRKAPDEAARSQAERTLGALVTRTGQKCLEPLLDGLADAQPAPRIMLLEQLGSLGGSRALAAVRAAVASGDAELSDGAFRILAGWADWEAASELMEVVQRSDQATRRALAFRGYVRLCREIQAPMADRLARLTEAARFASDVGEKTLVASALADIQDSGSLKMLADYLEDAALVEPASQAILKVASALGTQHKDLVAPALHRVVTRSGNPDTQKQAREALKKFGVSPP